jgi:DNA adenine methylase
MGYYSPLRYPGGKGKISQIFKQIIKDNLLCDGTYIELYAGGASVALALLLNEYVSKIIINDLDDSIYSFWHSVLYDTEKLCQLIKDSPINIDCWDKQKYIQINKEKFDKIDTAFSTLFLNRTNFSGVLKGGIIGGRSQTGKWKIDARFNKETLINRIERIALYKDRIVLSNEDAIKLLKKYKNRTMKKTILYLDPPYYIKGKDLYLNYYNDQDHENIADTIKKIDGKWVITYDRVPFIKKLYKSFRQIEYSINYSVGNASVGNEIFIFSNNMFIPDNLLEKKRCADYYPDTPGSSFKKAQRFNHA